MKTEFLLTGLIMLAIEMVMLLVIMVPLNEEFIIKLIIGATIAGFNIAAIIFVLVGAISSD